MLDISKNNNILEGIRATDTESIKREINYAIDNGFAISLQYKQASKLRPGQNRKGTSVRYVEPWGIGNDKRTNNLNVRVYQVSGDSTRGHNAGYWKTISVSNIINVIVLDGEDGTGAKRIENRSDFKINDAHINFVNYVGKNQRPDNNPENEPELNFQVPAPTRPAEQPEPEPERQTRYGAEELAEQIKRIKKLIRY